MRAAVARLITQDVPEDVPQRILHFVVEDCGASVSSGTLDVLFSFSGSTVASVVIAG